MSLPWKDLGRIPPVKLVMTPFPHSVAPTTSLAAAEAMMSERGIRHLPVKRDGELIGVLTERDLQRRATDEDSKNNLCIEDVMVRETYVVDLNTPLDEVVASMAERHIGSALVLSQGRLAGIFTTTDACRFFGKLLRSLEGKGTTDEVA